MKKNLHISQRAIDALEANGFQIADSGISERANNILDRYLTLFERTDPGLSEAEENAVVDAHWSHWFHQAELDINLDINVEEALADGLAEKWNIDGPALVSKLQTLNDVQKIMLIERIEKRKNT